MSVAMRQRVEKSIARVLVRDIIAAGYLINIDNGGDGYELPQPTNSRKLVMNTMFATDEERLYVFKPGEEKPFAWVYFVYGNDGWDVISDYTTNLGKEKLNLMVNADKMSEKYQ
jgi:hypothetical protein